MRFLKNIFLLLLLIIVVAAIYLATLDGSYDIARTKSIKAEPVIVFNDLNDYKNWKDWGPWYEKDSTIRVQYADNTIGTGGGYSWTSDVEGGGSMKTISIQASDRLDQEIIFETPFGDMKSDVYWILKKTKEGTDLTWGIKGEMPFFSRFMASGMEEQLGPMEEKGLELFNENIQRKLKVYTIDSLGVVDYSGGFYLYLSTSTKIDNIDPKLQKMMDQIEQYVSENKVRLTGSPFTIYHKFDQENGTTMFSVGYPIAERIITHGSDILTGYMERGTYSKTLLKGSYSNSKEAWDKAIFNSKSLKNYIFLENGEPFEIYINNPSVTLNPAELLTEIYLPVKSVNDNSKLLSHLD